MRNVEEHKKLLEQIAELGKNSVNYFDVEREFFLIDSDNLSDVQTRFYGYSIQESGIYEEDNLTEEAVAGLDGRGCYVYVEVRDGQITIKQDLNGSWGIYLFRHGDYFALSNSFFRLLDYVKFRYPLTVNRDYCNYLISDGLCSIAYSETAVNEIRLVDRSAIVHINVVMQTLYTESIDYKEYSRSIDTEEGIATLDRWVEFWSNVFRGIAQHTKFMQADLSGGFDTRVSLLLLLNSGIDLNSIRIFSVKDELHTHKEDYDIASQIANRYSFKLNRPLPAHQVLVHSFSDIFNADSYSNQTFSNIPKFWSRKSVDKIYRINGAAGETIRHRWQITPREFIDNQNWKKGLFSPDLSEELLRSIEIILKSGFNAVCDKYQIEDPDNINIPQYLYYETWSRHHFGKDSLCNYLMNNILNLSPVLDPEIRTLRLNTSEWSDANLLISLLFTRYEPDLLTFPLDLNRTVAPETIAYAQKLNERFPRRLTTDKLDAKEFHLQPRDLRAEKILSEGRNNKTVPATLLESFLKAQFDSSRTYGLFTAHFSDEFYHYAASYYSSRVFGRFRILYAVTGVARVLEDVEISQRNRPPYRDMQRFLEQDFCLIHDDGEIIRKFNLYFTARVQIQLLQKMADGSLGILFVSDNRARITQPEWFQRGGIGYVIQSYSGNLKIVAKTFVTGRLQIRLLGIDIRDREDKSKRIPYWIDYTRLIVNKKTLFDTLTPAWHDKPYIYTTDVKADEEITLEVEWLPHRSDT